MATVRSPTDPTKQRRPHQFEPVMSTAAILSLHTSPLLQPGSGDSGGMNVYVRQLGASLAQSGVDVRVFVRRNEPDSPEVTMVEPGLEVVQIDAGAYDLPKERLLDILSEFTAGVERHLLERPAKVIHANYWLSAIAGHELKHRHNLPLITTFHTLARVKSEDGMSEDPELDAIRDQHESQIIGCSDAICASNPFEAQQIVDLYGADPTRIELVPPGVDHAFFSPGSQGCARQALGFSAAPTFLFVGRIQPLKGLSLAVSALGRMKSNDARLVIVGGPSGPDGPQELERVQKLIAEHGLTDRVEFIAPQQHHMLSTYYRSATAVVVPSRSESFGLVALEAAACGIPVVATAVGGLQSIVDHERTGLLVDTQNTTEFAAALDRVIDNPIWANELGEAAAQKALQYSWSTTAGRLRRLYGDLSARSLVECQ